GPVALQVHPVATGRDGGRHRHTSRRARPRSQLARTPDTLQPLRGLTSMVMAALPVRPVAVGIVLVGFFLWVAYLLRLGAGGAPGTLPANIKPYLTDEELEGRKVVQTGVVGLLTAV